MSSASGSRDCSSDSLQYAICLMSIVNCYRFALGPTKGRPFSVIVKTPPRLCLAVGDNGLVTAVTNELLVLALHCHSGHRTPGLAAAVITSTSRHTSGRRIAEIPDQSRPLIISRIAFLLHLLWSMQYDDGWQQSFIFEMCQYNL